MIDYSNLWEYQQTDLQLTAFENELKQSQTRIQLLQVRNELLAQQEQLKKLEEDVHKGNDECALMIAGLSKITEDYTVLMKEFAEGDKEELSHVKRTLRQLDEYNKQLSTMRRELNRLSDLAGSTENTLQKVRASMAKGKESFDTLKEAHDNELQAAAPKLEELKAALEKVEPSVDKDMLEEYKRAKQTWANPLAKVQNEQCTGCHMSIPSLMMRRLKDGNEMITCENCGRLLWYQEEE